MLKNNIKGFKKMKKLRNYLIFYITFIFKNTLNLKPWSKEFKFKDIFNLESKFLEYISNKLKIIVYPPKKIGKFFIDTTLVKTNLCDLGQKFKTDKSPYNKVLHRHPYTGVYELLFSSIKEKNINIAEIGILNNASIKMWRKYFSNARIYGFEFDDYLLKNAKKSNLKKVIYKKIDVTKKKSISQCFQSCKTKFNIIIDDSTHTFQDQINVIQETYKFLVCGGILIIEDIPINRKEYKEERFHKYLKNYYRYFSFINFIHCDHISKFSKGWNNDKMLVLIRNNIK